MFKSIMQKIEEKKAALVRKSIVAVNNKQGAADLLSVVVLSAGAIALGFLFTQLVKTQMDTTVSTGIKDGLDKIFGLIKDFT